MSPEQFDSSTLVDERVDIYGLGVTLLELACGQPVFPGSGRREIEQRIISGDRAPPRLLDPQLPGDLETILLKAAATERADRYLSAGEMADDLQRWLTHQPIHARRVGKWERAQRWVSRNRRVAVLGATIACLLGMITVFATLLAWKFAADARREQVTTHAQTIRLAQLELQRGNYEIVQRELLSLAPAAGEEDLRGFPWYWLWDECQTGAAKHTIRHDLGVGGLAWSTDDSSLVSSSWSYLYGTEIPSYTSRWKNLTQGGVITSLTRIDSTGDLVSGRDDGSVTFWNHHTGAKLRQIDLDLPADQAVVRSISQSVDGRFLAIAASAEARYGSQTPGHVWIWDIARNELVHQINDGLEGRVFAGFTPERLVVASYTGELKAFELGAWQLREQLDCHGMVTSLAISADHRLAATASATGRGMEMRSHIDVWDADRWQRRSTLAPHDKPIRASHFNLAVICSLREPTPAVLH